jgi:hypothetical protein
MIPQFDAIEGEIHNFNRKGIAFIKQAVGAFLVFLVKPLAATTEAVFRKEFGERYFTAWDVFAGAGLIVFSSILALPLAALVAAVTGLPWLLFALPNLLFGAIWLVTFLVFSFMHLGRIRERTAQGILWHSYCCGCSRVSEKWQPFYPVVLGIVLCVCQLYGPGVLMIASGFISLLMRVREAALFYARVLDTIDARIENEQLSDAVLKRSDPKATSGFVAPLPAYVSRKHRAKFLQGMGAQPRPAVGPVVNAAPDLNSGLAVSSTPSIPALQAMQIAARSLVLLTTRTGLRAFNWMIQLQHGISRWRTRMGRAFRRMPPKH